MIELRGKVMRGSKDHRGRLRKWIEIPALYSEDFNPGDVVTIKKLKQES
jgi:hypothetical protein